MRSNCTGGISGACVTGIIKENWRVITRDSVHPILHGQNDNYYHYYCTMMNLMMIIYFAKRISIYVIMFILFIFFILFFCLFVCLFICFVTEAYPIDILNCLDWLNMS